MNFFKRFTSVFFCCVLLSSFFVVPVSAADDSDYYSLPSVVDSEPSSASLYPVTPSATGDGWSSADSSRLRDIWQALTDSSSGNSGSIAYCVWWIWNYLKDDIRSALGSIQQNTLATASRILDSNSLLGSINNSVNGINGYATENTLSSFSSAFASFFGIWKYNYDDNTWPVSVSPDGTEVKTNWKTYYLNMLRNLTYDTGLYSDSLTLRGMVKRLQETLASDDDRQLAENYKENREQAEKDFLSGKSGKTSLGKDDFGSLSGVGGTFKDITSLNGQASIGSFTDGLSSANETGQGWFSQATKDALDSVSDSSSNVSTFSADGDYMEDVDIYNMSGFEDHYAWLWGD